MQGFDGSDTVLTLFGSVRVELVTTPENRLGLCKIAHLLLRADCIEECLFAVQTSVCSAHRSGNQCSCVDTVDNGNEFDLFMSPQKGIGRPDIVRTLSPKSFTTSTEDRGFMLGRSQDGRRVRTFLKFFVALVRGRWHNGSTCIVHSPRSQIKCIRPLSFSLFCHD